MQQFKITMNSDFFDDKDNSMDFSSALNLFMDAYKSNQLDSLSFSEEEFEYIILDDDVSILPESVKLL